jgi:hypothetical protein
MSEAGLRVDGYGFHTSIPASARPVGSDNLPLRDPWSFFLTIPSSI